jgi:hypothetical protein
MANESGISVPDVKSMKIINFDGSDSTNIRSMCAELNLHESLMNNTLYGNMVIYDGINMLHELPIIGEETLELIFQSMGGKNPVKRLFRIYKIDTRQPDKNDKATSYTLHFTSREKINDLNTKIQQSFSGKEIHKIVQSVYDSYIKSPKRLKEIEIEETVAVHDIVVPNLSPFQTMNYLAKRAEGKDNTSSTFIFFENHEKFYFQTVEKTMRAASKQTYYYKPANFSKKGSDEEVDEQYIIQVLDQHLLTDVMKNIMTNMYSGTALTHDLIRKKYTTHGFDYRTDYDAPTRAHIRKVGNDGKFKDGKFVTEKANFTNNSKTTLFIPTQLKQSEVKYIKDKKIKIHPKRTELFKLAEKSGFAQMDNIVYNLVIHGDHTRQPGDMITLRIPKFTSLTKQGDPEDKFYSGNYLVTEVRHKINVDTFTTVLQVVKDSYEQKIKPGKVVGRKFSDVANALNMD